MKPVRKTKRGGPNVPPEERGDCWNACLASILEVPIEAVPVPHSDDPEHHWWDESQAALEPHGYEVVQTSWVCWPRGYWIAAVPSKNLGPGVNHVIVMHGDRVAHDPCLGERYPTCAAGRAEPRRMTCAATRPIADGQGMVPGESPGRVLECPMKHLGRQPWAAAIPFPIFAARYFLPACGEARRFPRAGSGLDALNTSPGASGPHLLSPHGPRP